jgi:large subunit ribosomal protein L10
VRKSEKAELVQALQHKVDAARISILTDFTGLSVEDMTRLRRQVQEAAGELKVVKNTLLKRATGGESAMAALTRDLSGPNALTLGFADPVAVTKVLIKFAQERPQFKIKAGILAGTLLSAQDLDVLSKLPPQEVLYSQLLGLLLQVPTALVTVLSGIIRNLLHVLTSLKDKRSGPEETGEAA